MKWATKIRKLPPWARIVEDMCRGQGALGALRELRTSKPDAFSILNLTKFSQILEKGMCSKSDRPKCGPVICYMLYVWFFLEIETVYGEVDTEIQIPKWSGCLSGWPYGRPKPYQYNPSETGSGIIRGLEMKTVDSVACISTITRTSKM